MSSIFSTTIWLNVTSVIALLYAIYLCSKDDKQLLKGSSINLISLIIIVLTTIYIGTRPITSYGDTYLYTLEFNLVQSGAWSGFKTGNKEPFFNFIRTTCVELTDASGWLFTVSIFYVLGMAIGSYRFLPKHILIILIFLFTSFSFWGYATNGIRNGMATSIAIVGLSFFMRTKIELIIGYMLLFLAMMTHKSCLLVIVAASAALFLRNTKTNITIWLFCILLGLLFQEQFKALFSGLIDDGRMASYLNEEVSTEMFSKTGFRWDFLLYSALPIFIGRYAIAKQKIEDKTYTFILHTYIFSNAFWVLINSAAYSNRFAYLSWFLYPIVLIYPFCKFKFLQNQSVALGLLLICMTAFTYFM